MTLFVPKDRRSLFRQFLAGMYDAVIITDPNGHILDINSRATEHFGYELDDVLDKPISVVIPGLQPEVVHRIRKGLEGDHHVMIDANGVDRDGVKIACEIAVSVIDLMNPGDLVFTIRNIERRREIMNSLRSRANAFAHSPSALFACDREGRIIEANAALAELFAMGGDDSPIGRTLGDFLDAEELAESFDKTLSGVPRELSASLRAGGRKVRLRLFPNRIGRKMQGVVGNATEIEQ